MGKFLMKPKVDFAFKEIMNDEKARIGFLSAVLHLDPADIRETTILKTDLRKVHEGDKQGILDVRILLNNDTDIDVEIQLAEQKTWTARALFYVCKMYADQLEEGQDYGTLKKCVGISVLNFDLFKGETEFYSRFHIREDTRGILYTDRVEFHVIELPKLPAELKDGDAILLWAKFIDAEQEEEFQSLTGRDEYMDSALRQLEVISQNPDMRMEYEARQKAIRDYNQLLLEAEQRGIEKVARNLLSRGFSTDDVADMTGLTMKQVEKLKAASDPVEQTKIS